MQDACWHSRLNPRLLNMRVYQVSRGPLARQNDAYTYTGLFLFVFIFRASQFVLPYMVVMLRIAHYAFTVRNDVRIH